MRHTLYLLSLLLALPGWAQSPDAWGRTQGRFALKGATVMVAPGETVSQATLLIEDGRVRAVGKNLVVPPGFRAIDLDGKVIHAAFIEPFYAVPVKNDKPDRVQDEMLLARNWTPESKMLDELRGLGFLIFNAVPEKGTLRGQSALYAVDGTLLKESVTSVFGYDVLGWERARDDAYPISKMGNVALMRQFLLDSHHFTPTRLDSIPLADLPRHKDSLKSFSAVLEGKRPLFAEANSVLDVMSLEKTLAEVPVKAVVLSGEEWRAPDWFAGRGRYILPLAFPKNPKPERGQSWAQVSLNRLRGWYYGPANPAWLSRRQVRFALTGHRLESRKDFPARLRQAIDNGLAGSTALAALTTEPAELLGVSERFGSLRTGHSATFVVRDRSPFDGESKILETWLEGKRRPLYAELMHPQTETKKEDKDKKKDENRPVAKPPENLFPPVLSPASVLVKNATIWTQGPAGTLVADLLVRDGKIVGVGPNLGGAEHVIDATGMHLTPGLIDAHSHTAVDGMVNEPSLNITSMVRIKDVIDPFDHDIYLQLAGGTTTANVMHGSANSIGGQLVTLKWRYGSSPEGLIMNGAPEGIKFALGENPKKSNWGEPHPTRYPQSRLGVIESIRGAFATAKNYRNLKNSGAAPRPDLALDALVEVLEGGRKIHCHSYRQDEILALIRLAEQEGFKVDVFQHVLEGYKVADEIAAHGAAASTFADWWAYKYEVIDAIPYNAALMSERGVNVSINSDSDDHARRLNTEAAKSIRYGGMSEAQALALVTSNPATQLGVIDRIGTLEPGKEADFVLWNTHPLSQQAVCQQTWIEGRRYYDRNVEAKRVESRMAEYERLRKEAEK